MPLKFRIPYFAILLLSLLLLSACATVKKPLTGIVPGREIKTLQSSISVSVTSGEHTTSGHGYLLFKEPDSFHMALLSPFGLTMFEVFMNGDRLTGLVPSKEEAYTGLFSELPESSPLQSLTRMRWVIPRAPETAPRPGTKELVTSAGDRLLLDELGLVERKISPLGDEVSYDDYRNVNGVAFPEKIVIASRYGAKVKIVFDDPLINDPVEDSALTPNLEGYKVLPLSAFRSF